MRVLRKLAAHNMWSLMLQESMVSGNRLPLLGVNSYKKYYKQIHIYEITEIKLKNKILGQLIFKQLAQSFNAIEGRDKGISEEEHSTGERNYGRVSSDCPDALSLDKELLYRKDAVYRKSLRDRWNIGSVNLS